MNPETKGGADAAHEAVADLQHDAFEKAKRVVEVARAIFTGDEAGEGEPLVAAAGQATCAPSSDTVQNPASE